MRTVGLIASAGRRHQCESGRRRYGLGARFVLRVPLDHPGHTAQAGREAAAIPAAVRAGVSTPRLVAFDDSLQILPVPFLIVERVNGTNAESLGYVPPAPEEAWRRVGADIARLHRCEAAPPPGQPWPDERRDPRELADLRAQDGWISPLEARRLQAWLDRLAPLVMQPAEAFCHGDLQMSNVLLDPATGEYKALIDWGGARCGNPLDDFSVLPLAAVTPMLEGYREHTPAEPVITEALILWRRTQLVLGLLPHGAAPGWAWAERPIEGSSTCCCTFTGRPTSRGGISHPDGLRYARSRRHATAGKSPATARNRCTQCSKGRPAGRR